MLACEGYNRRIFQTEANMQSSPPVIDIPARKNRTPLIVAISVVILCCFCSALAIAIFYAVRINSVRAIPQLPVEEGVPVIPTDSQSTTEPSDIGEAPEGGLGNDVLRNDTWKYVAFAAIARGCDRPVGADTKIVVLQQPQDGVWVEKWTVACASGESYPFEIQFTLDPTGTRFDIKPAP